MTETSIFKKNIKLHLDKDKRYYISGDTISGSVILDVPEPLKVSGIFVKIKGEGLVHWNEVVGQTSSGKNKTKNIEQKERFLREFITLWTPGNATADKDGDKKMAAGTYSYPWSLKLPVSLPSSYKCSHGYVKYNAKVTVDRPWSLNWTDQHEVYIISSCDLDSISFSMDPIAVQKHMEVGGTFRSRRPITVKVRLPSQGLAINRKIPIDVNINNISPRDVVSSSLKLRQECVMSIGSFQKTYKREEVFKVKHGKVEAGHEGTWDDVQAILPCLPTTGGSWKNMQFNYVAEFVVSTARSGPRLHLELPVVIGTHRGSSSSPAVSLREPSPYHTPPANRSHSPNMSSFNQSSKYSSLDYDSTTNVHDTASLQDCDTDLSGYSHLHTLPMHEDPTFPQSLYPKAANFDLPTAPEPSAPPPTNEAAYNPHFAQSDHNTTWPHTGLPNFVQSVHNSTFPNPGYSQGPPSYTPYPTHQNPLPGESSQPYSQNPLPGQSSQPYSQNPLPGQSSEPYSQNPPFSNYAPRQFPSPYLQHPLSANASPREFVSPSLQNRPDVNYPAAQFSPLHRTPNTNVQVESCYAQSPSIANASPQPYTYEKK